MNAIRVIRRTELANDVAGRWHEQYCDEGKWRSVALGNSEDIYKKIVAANGDPDKIDAAIGNKSWTRQSCSSCGEYFVLGVEMLEPDYETTPFFCADCIWKAATLLDGVKATGGAA